MRKSLYLEDTGQELTRVGHQMADKGTNKANYSVCLYYTALDIHDTKCNIPKGTIERLLSNEYN